MLDSIILFIHYNFTLFCIFAGIGFIILSKIIYEDKKKIDILFIIGTFFIIIALTRIIVEGISDLVLNAIKHKDMFKIE